jgi:hypothetical protein
MGGKLCGHISFKSIPFLKSRCKNPSLPTPCDLGMLRIMIMFTLCFMMGRAHG